VWHQDFHLTMTPTIVPVLSFRFVAKKSARCPAPGRYLLPRRRSRGRCP
jgi:hypothetical protein